MRHTGKLLASAAVGAAGLIALPAGSAHADTISALPITSFYQIVADTAHGHLFISQGSSSQNHILVTNLAGQQVATIGGQDGVMGMALSPDGSTLYAALASSHAVSAISTATLSQTAVYPLGDADTPADVATQSGKLWVSYDTGTAGQAAIGDFDLSATSPALQTQAAMGGWYAAPEIAADPSGTGVLVAAEPGMSPASVASYDVSVDPVTVRAQSQFFQNCENENDLAVVPGGAEFILACSLPYAHYRYSTADLSQQGSYASTYYPDAVAIAASGTVAAGIGENTSPAGVYVYAPGGDTPLNTYQPGGYLAPRGLAWSADGSQLYTVVQSTAARTTGTTYTLRVLYPPLDSSVLSMTGSTATSAGNSVPITGLLAVSGAALPAGTAVAITRTPAGGSATSLGTVPVGSDGRFTLTDTPPAPGTYVYTASYSGSTGIAPATASYTLTVTPATATLSLSGPSTAHVGRSLSLAGTLTAGAPLPAGSTVTVTRTVTGDSAATRRFTLTPGSGGRFTLTDTPPTTGSYTYTASYAGTAGINAAHAVHTVSVTRAPVSLKVTTGATTFNYKPTVHVLVHLGPTDTNRTVSVYARPFGGARVLLKTGRVNSSGNLALSYAAPYSTTFTAVFKGDARYAPATVAHTVYVRAKVSLAIGGYYASRRIHGVTYRLYHHTAHLNAAAAVAPGKGGECVKLQAQEYYRGAWHANTMTGCGILNRASKVAGYLTVNKADRNYPYRIRADYIRATRDTRNLNADSGWLYFMVEK